jgi:hypothetical protein
MNNVMLAQLMKDMQVSNSKLFRRIPKQATRRMLWTRADCDLRLAAVKGLSWQ